jgi:protein-disulfide isomerase
MADRSLTRAPEPSSAAWALLAAVALAAGCTNGSTNGATPQPTTGAGAETAATEQPAAADTPRTPVAATKFDSFPAVTLDGLSAYQKAAFTQLANEEICPCDCPKSWGACLQAGTKCQPAVLLAEWTINQLAAGVEAEILAEQITEEIGAFTSRPKTVTTAGYGTKGSKTPKYTIVEYADFECGHCKIASATMSELVERRGGQVKVVYKHFPLSFHPMARKAAAATEAAGKQGKFWEMHDAVFATQTMLDDDLLVGHARALGLNVDQFKTDLTSSEIVKKVDDSHKEGEKIGVEATPTFLVNGRPFNLMRTLEAFELRFAMEDARASSSCQ